MHRDLSCGNVLVDAHGRTRLIDFEFAKMYANTDEPEFRVVGPLFIFCFAQRSHVGQGPSSFMAVEVDGQDYYFEPGSSPPANIVKLLCKQFPLLDGDDVSGDETDATLLAHEPIRRSLASFFYNPLHDLESLWLLTGYFTFEFSGKLSKTHAPQEAKGKLRRMDLRCLPMALFEDDHVRFKAMTHTGQFAEYAYLLPEHLRPAGAALEKFRRELVARYQKTEESEETVTHPAFDGLHEVLAETMRTIADVFAEANKEQVTQSKKRSRDAACKEAAQMMPDEMKRPRVV